MSKANLRVLFVASHCPFAPSYGTQLRMLNIARLLKRVGDVSFAITDNYERILDGNISKFEFEIKLIAQLKSLPRRGIAGLIRHELSAGCLETEGFQVRQSDQEAMAQLIAETDICWVHGLQTANMFAVYKWPRSVLDIDDIPSRLFASQATNSSIPLERLANYRRAFLWWRRERILGDRFSVVAVTNAKDRRYLGNRAHISIIPNGFEAPSKHHPKILSEPKQIGFIGTLKWFPNRDGVEWFVHNVWPHIKREMPAVRLRLVGEGSDRLIGEVNSDIDGLGWVEDPGREIASWSAMIVPVRSGAGTRVKIAEAFSKRCPVVSTSLGVSGYEVISEEEILLADSPMKFAEACIRLLKDQQLGERLSENAWNKFVRKWTWEAISGSVSDAVIQCQRAGA